jgi:hypothetical protein
MSHFNSNLQVRLIAVTLAVAGLQACALVSSQSVYEGIRGAEKTKTTGTTQTPAALPNYDRYEKEREILKK